MENEQGSHLYRELTAYGDIRLLADHILKVGKQWGLSKFALTSITCAVSETLRKLFPFCERLDIQIDRIKEDDKKGVFIIIKGKRANRSASSPAPKNVEQLSAVIENDLSNVKRFFNFSKLTVDSSTAVLLKLKKWQ